MPAAPPLVLCISGHDPTGGAGIHADIEAIGALGAHALTVITAHTVQDTSDVRRVSAVPPILIASQIEALAGDCRIAAVKVGLIGDVAQLEPIGDAIRRLRVPVVVDPVLRAGGGARLTGAALQAGLRTQLLPLADLATPNLQEARVLAGLPADASARACAARLLDGGLANVLVTGGDEPGAEVVNLLLGRAGEREFRWPRLPGRFHGAGCTLASAIAALLARGQGLEHAVAEAQAWTQAALARALAIGQGRPIPGRAARPA